MKIIFIVLMAFFLIGCEDVNTYCKSDTNDTNETNETNMNTPDPNTTYPDENTTYPDENITYFVHENIKSSLFWVGEPDENNVSNEESAWDSLWQVHFGGIDTPDERNEYYPEAFTPSENPFYVALPYNDLDEDGYKKQDILTYIPWATENDPETSICKNRWVKITANRKSAFAQWEDVDPSQENDIAYVFGTKSPTDSSTGLAVSPAVRDYLGLDNNQTVDWEFVESNSVPDGPWRDIVTTSKSDQ